MKFVLAQAEDQNMKRSRFSEEQIIGILKEQEAGVPVSDLCRKHGVGDASIYKWKSQVRRHGIALALGRSQPGSVRESDCSVSLSGPMPGEPSG